MKAIDFAVSRILPEDMRQDGNYDLSKKGMGNIMAQVASKYPERFGEIAQKLGNLGRNAAWYQGYTTSASDTRPIIDTTRYYAQMDAELDDLRKQKLDKDDFGEQRTEIYMKYSDMIEKDTMKAALGSGNNFARAVASGARGNAAHVKAILSTPGVYSDSKGRIIPMFVRNSFSGGLRPAEVLAGTYGARSAVISTKSCLREGTLVRMADGSSKPIQGLKVGDWVVGSDTAGVTAPTQVTALFDQGPQAVWLWEFGDVAVECTEDHKFLTGGPPSGFETRPVSELRDRTVVFGGGKTLPLTRISYVGELPCWDISVNNTDHLFLLENGLIVSNSTAKGGDAAKLISQGTSNYNVTEKDCGVGNGLDLLSDDESLTGRVLAMAAGDLPAGTVVDRQALARIRKIGKPVVVRSAMTCNAAHGLCAKCVGVQANGYFPKVGDSIGITAGHAISEPMVQAALNCLVEGTMVRMADYSEKLLHHITPGEWVMGADIFGDTFPVKVLALHDQGLQPVKTYSYSATPKQLISVTCTVDHPILQITKYSRAKEEVFNKTPRKLPAGRKAGLPSAVLPRNHTPADHLISVPLSVMMGYFMGDGIRVRPHLGRVDVSCACADTVSDLKKVVEPFGMHIVKSGRLYDWRISKTTQAIGRSKFRTMAADMGLDDKYAHEKNLPVTVWTWDQRSVAAFIAGFVSADGSVFRNSTGAPGISLASTALPMLRGLKELLELRFGIYSSALTRTAPAGHKNHKHDAWAFAINRRDQVLRFHEYIASYIPGGKGRKLTQYLAEAPKSHFQDLPYYKSQRRSIVDAGEQRCWDLSVDHPDELFVLSNNLIVKNTKHNSGMAKGKKSFSGFSYVSQFVQIPDEFKDRAAVSELAGTVEKIEDAPQGGKFITVGGESHFVLPGFASVVKVGDNVEAGGQLSEGLVNPSDIVRLRGLGEGRRYYAERLGQILTDSGSPPDKRNVEILARSAVDNYITEDPDEDSPWSPDESVRSADFIRGYTPPKDTADTHISKAVGTYLQKPVLHYSIGTKLTPKMTDRLQSVGIENVSTSRTEPWFRPEMKRLRTAAHDSKDWLVSMGTSYLTSQMRDALERGEETNVQENYHFGPRLAYGADAGKGAFGENVETTGKF